MSSALAVTGVSIGSFLLGLAVGRLLNVAIDRVPRRDQEAGPAKAGSCRWRVMALNALGFVLAYLQFGLTWRLLLAWAFIAVLIAIAFIDLENMIIPNRIVLPASVLGLAASIALEPRRWWVYLAAAAGAALFLFLLALIWRGGMGAGDVKMALLLGAVLGGLVVVALFLAFILGALIGIVLIATKRKTRKDAIPFGPYLALGSVLALLAGDRMLDSYFTLLH